MGTLSYIAGKLFSSGKEVALVNNPPELQAFLDAGNPMPTWDGADYVDSGALGTNPTAKIYPDGAIVGNTDNGDYTKRPDGSLLVEMIEISIAGSLAYVFPHVFSTQPISVVSMLSSGTTVPYVLMFNSMTTSQYVGTVRNSTNGTATAGITVRFAVTGRWK